MPREGQVKVCYRLIDPSQYQGKHALVVGGGDSALERRFLWQKSRVLK